MMNQNIKDGGFEEAAVTESIGGPILTIPFESADETGSVCWHMIPGPARVSKAL
jgi:hypothetical protein